MLAADPPAGLYRPAAPTLALNDCPAALAASIPTVPAIPAVPAIPPVAPIPPVAIRVDTDSAGPEPDGLCRGIRHGEATAKEYDACGDCRPWCFHQGSPKSPPNDNVSPVAHVPAKLC